MSKRTRGKDKGQKELATELEAKMTELEATVKRAKRVEEINAGVIATPSREETLDRDRPLSQPMPNADDQLVFHEDWPEGLKALCYLLHDEVWPNDKQGGHRLLAEYFEQYRSTLLDCVAPDFTHISGEEIATELRNVVIKGLEAMAKERRN